MFSEYASKFLQQSQTRINAIQGRPKPLTSAPLFHSATDFLPEDPELERDRLAAFSLRQSRRYGAYASSTGGDDDGEDDEGDYSEDSMQELRRSRGRGRYLSSSNIRSSWRADRSGTAQGSTAGSALDMVSSHGTELGTNSRGKGRMVDVQLDQSEHQSEADGFGHSDMLGSALGPFRGYGKRDSLSDDGEDQHPPDDIVVEMPRDESPPSFQQFKRPPRERAPSLAAPSLAFATPVEGEHGDRTPFLPQETKRGQGHGMVPQQVYHPTLEPPSHDKVWGSLYILLMAGMFTTSFIVWLHTQEVNIPNRDTIYKTLHGSMHLLTVDTLVAIVISLVWMYLLKSFVKPLIYLIVVSVPVVLVTFSIYPFVMSFKAPEGGKPYGGQGIIMRWGSIIPAIMSVTWVYTAWKSRFALNRAIGIIQLACKIIGENPALVLLSFGTLAGTCIFTWVWVGMFTRVFLTGNILVGGKWWWGLNSKTIGLGVYYIVMYLWTLGISSGIHRATSAATVSQWYFHRHAMPKASSKAIMSAAFHHSTTTLFGSICSSALLALLVRLPLIVAPRRFVGIIHLFCFQFIASPIAALIDPLTLTYGAIHSLPLLASSRATMDLKFIDTAGFGPNRHPRAAYRLSKMILTAARGVTAMSLGIGAWVAAARHVNGGSVYGYLVGLIAGCIAWAIIGATEGCLSNVVDACLVCVGSEGSGGSHCREAQMVFGG